jgi:hypothetical protein
MFPAANAPTPPQTQSQIGVHESIGAGALGESEDLAMVDATEQQPSPGDPTTSTTKTALSDLLPHDAFSVFVEEEGAPGHFWKNRKAVEEMQKSLEQVLDKDFNTSTATWYCIIIS